MCGAEVRSGRREGERAASPLRRLAFSAVGTGSLFAFVLCVAGHADLAAGAVSPSLLVVAVWAFLVVVAVVGTLQVVCVGFSRVLDARSWFAAVVSGVLMVAGTVLFAMLASLAGADEPVVSPLPTVSLVAAAAGGSMGAGVALLSVSWSEMLSRFDAVCLVRVAAGAALLAGLWCAAFHQVGGFAPVCLVLA